MRKIKKVVAILLIVLASGMLILRTQIAFGAPVHSVNSKTGIGFTGIDPTPAESSSSNSGETPPSGSGENSNSDSRETTSWQNSETSGTGKTDTTAPTSADTASTESTTTAAVADTGTTATTLEEGVGNNGIRDKKDSTNGQSGSVLGKILPATGEKTNRVLFGLGVLILSMCAVYLWSKRKRGDSM